MIAYRKTNGRAHDARCVPQDYKAEEGEILLDVDAVPPLETLHDPVDEKAAHNTAIEAQILELEARVTPRRLREAVLGADREWIADIEQQIAALRARREG